MLEVMFPGLPAAAFETLGSLPAAQRLADSRRQVQAARDLDDFPALHAALRTEGQLLLLSGEPQAALGAVLEAVALCEVADSRGKPGCGNWQPVPRRRWRLRLKRRSTWAWACG